MKNVQANNLCARITIVSLNVIPLLIVMAFLVWVENVQDHLNFPDLPYLGPRILGVLKWYQPGDTITAACVSPVSQPAATLRWYINHDTADPSYITSQTQELLTKNNMTTITRPAAVLTKFQDIVMRLRSPLTSDIHQDSISPSSGQFHPNLFSVVRLHFEIRDKQLRTDQGCVKILSSSRSHPCEYLSIS